MKLRLRLASFLSFKKTLLTFRVIEEYHKKPLDARSLKKKGEK